MVEKPVRPNRPDPPRGLFFARRFEFTSALPLKECAARLKEADEMPTGCFNPPVFVSVNAETDEKFNFHMSVESRVGKGWVIGNLRPTDSLNTLISWRFGAGPEIVVLAVLLLILAPVIFYAELSRDGTGVVVGLSLFFIALFIVIFWYNMHWARSKLFKVFEQIVKV